jgi:hypothetical protein
MSRMSELHADLALRDEMERDAAPEMREALEEACRNLEAMIFMAEAAADHMVAAGDIDRAKASVAEIRKVLGRLA